MIRKFILFLIPLVLLSFAMHKYYVSITEASYNAEEKQFEISIKFIGHDLEHALEHAGAPELYLGTEKENPKADQYLLSYIKKRFELKANETVVDYNFVGKEVNNDDFIYCYLSTSKVDFPKTITIKNSLLVEKYEEQSNIVYLKVGDQKFNSTLNRDKINDIHQIKK